MKNSQQKLTRLGPAPTSSRTFKRKEMAEAIQAAVKKYVPNLDRSYNPIIELAIIGANENINTELRVKANSDVAKYLFHQLKAIDLTTNQPGNVTVMAVDFNSISSNMNPLQLAQAQETLKEMVRGAETDETGDEED